LEDKKETSNLIRLPTHDLLVQFVTIVYIPTLVFKKANVLSDLSQVKADIVPYTSEYARDVRSWIDCEETYYNLCRSKDFPPPPNVVETWQRNNITPYLLFSSNRPVAYAELWERRLEREIEITHLIVDTFKRGQGFGTKMLQLLYDRASQRKGIMKVVLHMFTDNHEALGCYLSAGFELVGTTPGFPGLRMIKIVK